MIGKKGAPYPSEDSSVTSLSVGQYVYPSWYQPE